MRVVVNCITDLQHRDGATIYGINLALHLARAAVDVIVLVGNRQGAYLVPEPRLRVLEVPIPHRPSAWQWIFQPYLWWKVRSLKPEIYHLPNSLPLLLKPCKTVITIHDVAELKVAKYSRVRTLYRWVTNWISVRRADAIITVSECSRKDIARSLALDERAIHVIYNAAAYYFQPLSRRSARQYLKSNYGISSPFVLGVGGWQENKNIRTLYHAMMAIWKDGKQGGQITLVILGNASRDRAKFSRDVRSSPFANKVVLPGYVPEAELPQFYSAAEVVVYPSLYEGFGLPAIESLACGAALIAFRTSSIPEVVADAALLVDTLDAQALAASLERLLSMPHLRRFFRERGLKRSQQFSWDKTARCTALVYRQVLGHIYESRRDRETE